MANKKTEGSGRRLLRLLEVIAGLGREFSLKELTAQAKLPTTTVHRLLQVLVGAEMVDRTEGLSYRPGVKLLRLASALIEDFDVEAVAHRSCANSGASGRKPRSSPSTSPKAGP